MPKRECNICRKIFNVPKTENARISLTLKYCGKIVEEYESEVSCPQCFDKLQNGMYTGIEGGKIDAKG